MTDNPMDSLTAPGYPPAKRVPSQRTAHGDTFTDPYEWMRDKESPAVADYVTAQNELFKHRMAPYRDLTQTLVGELRGRVHETDMSVPVRVHGYWYFGRTHEGQQYGMSCRVPVRDADDWTPPTVDPAAPLPGEEVIFDSNKEAQGHDFFRVGTMDLSRDGRWMLYGVDVHGDERYDLHIRDLATGQDLPEHIDGVASNGLITPDGKWVFYTKVDAAWRPYAVWRHRVGTPASDDQEAWREDDERFWAGVGMSFDEKRIVIGTDSKTTTEVLLLPVDDPTGAFVPFIPRKEGVEYDVSFASFEAEGDAVDTATGGAVSADGAAGGAIPLALVIHNVTNPNFEIDVIDMRSHEPPYTLGEGQVVAVGSPYGCEKASDADRAVPVDTPFSDPRNPAILQGLAGLRVDGIGMYRRFVTLEYRAGGLPHIAIMKKTDARRAFENGTPWEFTPIEPTPIDSADSADADDAGDASATALYNIGFVENPSYEAPTVRYSYTSFTRPVQLHQLNVTTGEDSVLKRREVPHYDASVYREMRVWVRVRDGQNVPVSLVWRRGLAPALDAVADGESADGVDGARSAGSAAEPHIAAPSVESMIAANRAAEAAAADAEGKPAAADSWLAQDAPEAPAMFITGYGAYGISSDPGFSVARPSLLDRGVVYALPHIRGGGEMGRAWYEQGRRAHKIATFTDFIDVTAALQAQGWVARSRTVACGGSAGGLLMGAIANMAPYLYAGVEADVPFVDALTSMLDPDLPLTVTEWDEWGDPVHDPAIYRYMKSYSPYENTATAAERDAAFGTTHFPHMFITTSMNDTRVLYVEPLKWIARLQESAVSTDTIARIEIEAGHGGGSGRYHQWTQVSEENAWTLATMGIQK
ncbi:MAG: prolyl oligopeptidase family serine peptidase [Bifidobacteriaceae bacterium]|nr:prolyl oligopeptidase family serine peptidase [Bifidobacteriaceae bacterium]